MNLATVFIYLAALFNVIVALFGILIGEAITANICLIIWIGIALLNAHYSNKWFRRYIELLGGRNVH